MGASLKPDFFEERVNLFVALAPIVRMDHIKNEFLIKTAFIPTKLLQTVFEGIHMYNVMPRTPVSGYEAAVCKALPTLCVNFESAFADWHPDIDNNARLAVDMAHSPSGAGWRQITHFD